MTRSKKKYADVLRIYGRLIIHLTLFLLFSIGLFLLVDQFKTYFPIKSVKVFGAKHLSQQKLQQTLIPLVNKGFFSIDVELIKEQLIQSAWVSKAVVQRVWPNQILITLIEKIPVAEWNQNALLSHTGELFTPDDKLFPKGLPRFVGPEGQHLIMLNRYSQMNKILLPLHLKIKQFELTPDHNWMLTFENGTKLNVNSKDDLTRMSHFVKVYPKIIGSRLAEIDYIDLRYQNGLSIRWKEVA